MKSFTISESVCSYLSQPFRAVFAIILFGIVAGQPLSSALATVVYPTGSYPLDVENVRTAVSGGGPVLLKAVNTTGQPTAFNFGPAIRNGDGVNLTVDVRIIGEQTGQHRTTIQGGFIPIICQAPIHLSIKSINFDGPCGAAIIILASSGAEIVGNHISNVVPDPLPVGFTETDGIDLLGGDLDPTQSSITGRAVVAGNVIENLSGEFANGVQFDNVAAFSTITGNTVRIPQPAGTVQSIGLLAFRLHNVCAIFGNSVTIGPSASNVYPSGIFVGGGTDGRYLITGNNIMSKNANADGIDVVGFNSSGPTNNAWVAANRVAIHSQIETSGGVVFYGAINNSVMLANRISGTSGNAIQILGQDDSLVADSNRVINNDISHMSSSVADIFFGPFSTNNQFVGHCASFIDQGINNHVSCGPMVDLGSGGTRSSLVKVSNSSLRLAVFDGLRERLGR